ncbi:hypothetical protein F0562_001753 [Nyssa sinensis]|uniref:Integrase catalytic domain-containing protein n=1 Tax=Nyssa sinensis TaxID=561372 RepID=A0A5J5C4J0_9ASTE|nr:hypothetical protein F0562_001753 [Nyssa sinensis]
MSSPHTPSQNGRAERKHRHIIEIGLAMLFHSHVPLKFWVNAFSTATFMINRLPTLTLDGLSPYEILYGKPPTYSNFHPFGCLVFPNLRNYAPHNLAPRSRSCAFLGYSMSHHGFRCLDGSTNQVFISTHAIFYELNYPFKGHPCSRPLPDSLVSAFLEPTTSLEASSHPSPLPLSCGPCLTENSVSLVPFFFLQDTSAEPLGSSNGSASVPTDPAPTAEVFSIPTMGHLPLLGTRPMQTQANKGPWVFVGLPNVVKAWNVQTALDLSLSGPAGHVYALVVGDDCSYSVSTRGFAGLKGDCIYFSDDTFTSEIADLILFTSCS